MKSLPAHWQTTGALVLTLVPPLARAEGSYHGIGYWLLGILISAIIGLVLLLKPFVTIASQGAILKARWLLMLLIMDVAACLVVGFTSFAITPELFATPLPWIVASLPGTAVARSYLHSARSAHLHEQNNRARNPQ